MAGNEHSIIIPDVIGTVKSIELEKITTEPLQFFQTYDDISIFVLRWLFAIVIAAKYEIPVHNNVNRRQKLGSPKCNTT